MGIITAILWGLFGILLNVFICIGMLGFLYIFLRAGIDILKGENIRIFW